MYEIEGRKKIASAALKFFAWLCTVRDIWMSLRALANKIRPESGATQDPNQANCNAP
jgi:hypothetical protein